eukprot:TRINITY_DN17420_c0_g1_i1.p1 TRINITY_DN17420_c0_g1~~TRINITY_DN17420_c0_g1_i1.p1  ORF type:complete len:392 (+),score=23.94 TRINITY_DN17420_c0_g1_i1:54-1229(+)
MITILANSLFVAAIAVILLYYNSSILENSEISDAQTTTELSTFQQFLLFPTYVLFLIIFQALVPGYDHKGTPVKDGTIYTYKINGLRLLVVLIVSVALGVHFELFKATIIHDNFLPILVTVNVSAFILSGVLYLKGRSSGHGSNNFVHDFVMGTELMPHLFGINIKFFWLRPAMMGWILINLSLAAKQYEILGHFTTSMLLYQIFTGSYVLDYFWFEEYMTSTWDIIAENFGLMLVWGDIVWIPFVFSIQGWFLIHDDTELSLLQTIGMVMIFLVGYTIFRGSNKQKHDFKHSPHILIWGKPAHVIGGRLLASGWWGMARHINYTGDIILGIAFSSPCRFSSIIPWTYPVYLTILLFQRERRDDAKCREKYGELWEKYCSVVPKRLIPYVY